MQERLHYAITRTPGSDFARGITTFEGPPLDQAVALEQHRRYCEALRSCGVEVLVLDPLEGHPDATFVEDTAIVVKEAAILCRPGALSRRGEVDSVEQQLRKHKMTLRIEAPGCLDGGDVFRWRDHFFVGLSQRTNLEGATQLRKHLVKWGYTTSFLKVGELLHLKTGLCATERHLLVAPLFAGRPELSQLPQLNLSENEAYAANCISLNGKLLLPAGFPDTAAMLKAEGYELLEVAMTEFEKMDGGLTCCSLLF